MNRDYDLRLIFKRVLKFLEVAANIHIFFFALKENALSPLKLNILEKYFIILIVRGLEILVIVIKISKVIILNMEETMHHSRSSVYN